MEQKDPFFIENEDLKVAIQILNGEHELQIEFKRLLDLWQDKNHQEIQHMYNCAYMMGYPSMFDEIILSQ